MPGDKLVAEVSDAVHNAVKSKTNVVSDDNRFVVPAGVLTDPPDVGDNNAGGDANVAVDGRPVVGDNNSPGNVIDGVNGNASVAAGDSFTLVADDFESKLK